MTNKKSGQLIWITGLPGSGKTTLAKKLLKIIEKQKSVCPIFIDGDQIRELFGNDLGYDLSDRLKNAYRIARLCQFLTCQGFLVICATNSLFHEIHRFNRRGLKNNYYEIFLQVDKEVILNRNKKNLYRGDATNVWHKDQTAQLPKSPHLTLKNNNRDALNNNLSSILNLIK